MKALSKNHASAHQLNYDQHASGLMLMHEKEYLCAIQEYLNMTEEDGL